MTNRPQSDRLGRHFYIFPMKCTFHLSRIPMPSQAHPERRLRGGHLGRDQFATDYNGDRQGRARRLRPARSPAGERTMIAARPTNPDCLQHAPRLPADPERTQTGAPPAEDPAKRIPPFRPLTPVSSARPSRHFSSAATRMASGSPVTPTARSAGFSCSRAPPCPLPGGRAGQEDVPQYTNRGRSNSIS